MIQDSFLWLIILGYFQPIKSGHDDKGNSNWVTGSNLNLTLTMTSLLMTSLTYEFGIFEKNSKTFSLKNLITSLMHCQAEFWINIYSRLPNQSNHFNNQSHSIVKDHLFPKKQTYSKSRILISIFLKNTISKLQPTLLDMRPINNFLFAWSYSFQSRRKPKIFQNKKST